MTGGCRDAESFSDGRWKKAVYRPGSVSMTAGGQVDRLRWQSLAAAPAESLHLYIPQYFFSAAQDEYRRAGTPARDHPLDSFSFSDPLVSQTALSLAGAVRNGAPDLYAQSAAQFLAAHLLSAQSGWAWPASRQTLAGDAVRPPAGAYSGIHEAPTMQSRFLWNTLPAKPASAASTSGVFSRSG